MEARRKAVPLMSQHQLRLAYVNLKLVSKNTNESSEICRICSRGSLALPPEALMLARLHRIRPGAAKMIGGLVADLLAEVVPPDER